MSKFVFLFSAFIFLSVVCPSVSYARNVTCRVMDKAGKIAGIYVHSSDAFPVCNCSNKDLPEKFKSVCTGSLKAF